MNKTEIIEYLANASVPEGAELVEHDVPGGLTVASWVAETGGIAGAAVTGAD